MWEAILEFTATGKGMSGVAGGISCGKIFQFFGILLTSRGAPGRAGWGQKSFCFLQESFGMGPESVAV
jgi:hypothetical protein